MGATMPRRILDRFGINRIPQFKISVVCSYWARGKCNRNPCSLLHRLPAASHKRKSLEYLVASCNQKTAVEHVWGSRMKCDTSPCSSTDSSSSGFSEEPSVSSAHPTLKTTGLSTRSQPKKKHTQVCTLWLKGNCANSDQCKYLHSWFRGEGFTMKTKLHGHLRDVTSLCLPAGSDKLYSGSKDGTVRAWDCHTGQEEPLRGPEGASAGRSNLSEPLWTLFLEAITTPLHPTPPTQLTTTLKHHEISEPQSTKTKRGFTQTERDANCTSSKGSMSLNF